MFLSPRAALRGTSAIARRTPSATFAGRRFLSTAPPTQRSRRWKSSLARWSLAGAVVYYYNTSNVFAESNFYAPNVATHTADETEQLPTVEELSAQRQQRKQAAAAEAAAATAREATRAEAAAAPQVDGQQPAGSPEALEEEAEGQGAFNPETGEINWDCPCLGGMAHGPCGDEFKAAFSCFVYSTEEPKGADCIEKFKGMQDCFRAHPDVYGAELEDDEELEAEAAAAQGEVGGQDGAPEPAMARTTATGSTETNGEAPKQEPPATHREEQDVEAKRSRAKEAARQVNEEHEPISESEEAVPKQWHDTRSGNEEKV